VYIELVEEMYFVSALLISESQCCNRTGWASTRKLLLDAQPVRFFVFSPNRDYWQSYAARDTMVLTKKVSLRMEEEIK